MLITQMEIYKSPIKLTKPFVTSLGPLEYAENIVVVIRTNEGMTGFGECSPFMTINGESMDTCFVVAEYLAKVLVRRDPLNIEACTLAMDKVIYGNSSIKSAFDMALYDIAAQHANQPLFQFLGGNQNKILATDYTVSIGNPEQMATDALEIKGKGFQVIKVKLGESGEKDIERIKSIRAKIGQNLPIRIDANQGWNMETAISTLNTLAPFNIQFCEEPIPRWAFMELPQLRELSPIPIMADECCSDHHDAKRLIGLSACDQFNVKLGKSSGIFKALKIIKLAEMANVKMQVGGFLESRLGFTAAAHLALVSDHIIHCDFDTPLMFVEDPVIGGISYSNNGVVTVPNKPGLGAGMEEGYLQRLTKMTIN